MIFLFQENEAVASSGVFNSLFESRKNQCLVRGELGLSIYYTSLIVKLIARLHWWRLKPGRQKRARGSGHEEVSMANEDLRENCSNWISSSYDCKKAQTLPDSFMMNAAAGRCPSAKSFHLCNFPISVGVDYVVDDSEALILTVMGKTSVWWETVPPLSSERWTSPVVCWLDICHGDYEKQKAWDPRRLKFWPSNVVLGASSLAESEAVNSWCHFNTMSWNVVVHGLNICHLSLCFIDTDILILSKVRLGLCIFQISRLSLSALNINLRDAN